MNLNFFLRIFNFVNALVYVRCIYLHKRVIIYYILCVYGSYSVFIKTILLV